MDLSNRNNSLVLALIVLDALSKGDNLITLYEAMSLKFINVGNEDLVSKVVSSVHRSKIELDPGTFFNTEKSITVVRGRQRILTCFN